MYIQKLIQKRNWYVKMFIVTYFSNKQFNFTLNKV